MAAAVLPPHGRYPRNSLLPEYTIGSESYNINQKRVTHDIPRILQKGKGTYFRRTLPLPFKGNLRSCFYEIDANHTASKR